MGHLDLTPYSPRLLLRWDEEAGAARHRAIEGTLVFADVSGFTRLSERLARTRGKAGAEEMTTIISDLFGELLTVAAQRGGEMLKFGGDAVLLLFRGDDHEVRAAAAAWELQARLRVIGRVATDAGPVRLRMSVGIASGAVDLFKVGRRHRELLVAGPVTTETARVETAAEAGEILLSPTTAAALEPSCLGAGRAGGRLLRRVPDAPTVPIVAARPSMEAGAFVSDALRDHLAGEVEPEHRLATVAFVHLMGIDGLLAAGRADDVAASLDDTLTIVQDAFADYGVSFLATDLAADGAKVLATAGAPFTGDDDERCMLLALRQMLDAGAPLAIRAGVNRGHVFAAAVGPPFRKTYTTMGDVTNTAARVMARAGAGEALVLGCVIEHARGRFAVTPLEPFVAKGKREPLVPLRLDAVEEDAPRERSSWPLVGRDVELRCLLTAATDVRAGKGALVEIVGDTGSGKSRLLEELLATTTDVPSFVTACEPYERSTPFHPVRRLLEQVLPGSLGDVVASVAPSLAPWLPLLASVFDREVDDTEETKALDARHRLTKTASVTADLLAAVLVEPCVIAVEDTHWLDDASAAVLRAVENTLATRPWLVCVTRRDEASTFTPAPDSSLLVHLAAIGEPDMHALVRAATVEAPLPPHRRDDLVSRAAGNPLYLTELLATADADGSLPPSLEAVMAAQIDRLPPADRSLLRLAAVLGSRFGLDLLAEVVGDPSLATVAPEMLAARLGSLLVPVDEHRLRFRHQLIRDVAYESLPFRRRRALHSLAASVIERLAPDPADRAGILSLHFANAAEHERCWHYARIAAARAGKKFANADAIQLLERAIAASRHVPGIDPFDVGTVWKDLGVRRGVLGDAVRSREAYREARRRCRGNDAKIASLCRLEARSWDGEGDINGVLRWLRRGMQAVASSTSADAVFERAELAVYIAQTRVRQGRLADGRRWAIRGLDDAVASGNGWAEACALVVLDSIDVAAGRPRDPARASRVLELCDGPEPVGGVDRAALLNNLGQYAYQESRWSEAVALYERSRDIKAASGNLAEAGYGTCNIAEILVDQGRAGTAAQLLDELATLWTSVGHTFGLAFVDFLRGRVAVARNELDAALTHLRAASDAFKRYDLAASALDADARIADCLLRSGDLGGARAALDEVIERDRAAGGTRSRPLILRTEAWYRALVDDVASAVVTMEESVVTAKAIDAIFDVALAVDGLAALGASVDTTERDAVLDELGVVAVPDAPERARPMVVPAG